MSEGIREDTLSFYATNYCVVFYPTFRADEK